MMADSKDSYVLLRLDSIKIPQSVKKEDADILMRTAQKSMQDEYLQLYLQHLSTKYGVKVNRELLESTYGPGSEIY